MAAIPKLDDANLQAIYDLLGDTSTGLTGCEIGRILRECGCLDPMASEDRATSDTVQLRHTEVTTGSGVLYVFENKNLWQPDL